MLSGGCSLVRTRIAKEPKGVGEQRTRTKRSGEASEPWREGWDEGRSTSFPDSPGPAVWNTAMETQGVLLWESCQQLCCPAKLELQCKASCVPDAPLRRRRSGIAGLESALPPNTAGLAREGQALFFLGEPTRSSEGLVLVDGFHRRQGRQGGKREGRGSLLRQALWCGRERATLHTVTLQSPRVRTPWKDSFTLFLPLPDSWAWSQWGCVLALLEGERTLRMAC